ncbi:AMP-binding protein [Aquirufa sp. HETE-83D]|uniref:AMP-binding protein n=1 Tax=Aquirufa esocilacus TaxID=3096513 RepID=A0ABW6DKP3_9BACT
MISHYQSNLENFLHWANNTPNKLYLRQPVGNQYIDYSYSAAATEVKKVAQFIQKNSKNGSKNVGILSKNSAHWMMADLAIAAAGGISVPFYATLTKDQLHQVLVHSECQILIVGKLDHWDKIKEGIPATTLLIHTPESSEKTGIQWADILANTEEIQQLPKPKPSDVATIVYTSGTTGMPKGVMITYGGIEAGINMAREIALLDLPNARFISYLPLCHIAERNFVEFAATAAGGTIHFVENLDTFAKNLASARPTHFLAVPRIWAKFQEGILQKIGSQKKLNLLLSIPVVKTFVQKKIQKGLGLDEAKLTVTGAAPISEELLTWFQKLGIFIQEAYGMTENMGLNAVMPRDQIKLGAVGRIHPDCETRIDSETQEIQMRAPYNTTGYFKEPKLTEELFTEDGWLRTGDQGKLTADRFISITGRVKDNFKTAKGHYVAPAPIENRLNTHEFIEQVCVVGVNLPQPIVLVVLTALAKSKEIAEVQEAFQALLNEVNPMLKNYEHLKKVVIVQEDWTIENECLTPTMKIKRPSIEKKYQANFELWYTNEASIIHE